MRAVTLIIRVLAWPFIWLFRLLTGEADWASVHARILPFGSAIGTYLVAKLAGNGEWAFWRNWDALMEAAGLGVIFHGIAAVVLMEGGIKMGLYVVDQWKADRARMRAESRAEGLAEGRAEGRTEGRSEALSQAVARLRQNPAADPVAVIEDLLEDVTNGHSQTHWPDAK